MYSSDKKGIKKEAKSILGGKKTYYFLGASF